MVINFEKICLLSVFMIGSMLAPETFGGRLGEMGQRTDSKDTPRAKIKAYFDFLREEVKSPTSPYRGGGGGMVTHDYILAQIPKGLYIVHRDSGEGLSYMKKLYRESNNDKVKKVLACAIAQCGANGEVEKQLMEILHGKCDLGPTVKAEAIHGLRERNALRAIPEIINAMENAPKEPTPGSGYVVSAANVALRNWGVETEYHGEYEKIDARKTEPDRESAINVLKQEIQETEGRKALQLTEALSKLDNEAAIKILKQQSKHEMESEVHKQAQEMLQRLKEE